MSAGLSNINYDNCTCSFVLRWILKAQKMYFIFFLSLRALCGDDTMKKVPRLFFGHFFILHNQKWIFGFQSRFLPNLIFQILIQGYFLLSPLTFHSSECRDLDFSLICGFSVSEFWLTNHSMYMLLLNSSSLNCQKWEVLV